MGFAIYSTWGHKSWGFFEDTPDEEFLDKFLELRRHQRKFKKPYDVSKAIRNYSHNINAADSSHWGRYYE